MLAVCCAGFGFAANGKTRTPLPTQGRNNREAEDDHVYAHSEVDVKAKITNEMENLPEPGKDCPRPGRGGGA